jgi:hypothetical protein
VFSLHYPMQCSDDRTICEESFVFISQCFFYPHDIYSNHEYWLKFFAVVSPRFLTCWVPLAGGKLLCANVSDASDELIQIRYLCILPPFLDVKIWLRKVQHWQNFPKLSLLTCVHVALFKGIHFGFYKKRITPVHVNHSPSPPSGNGAATTEA